MFEDFARDACDVMKPLINAVDPYIMDGDFLGRCRWRAMQAMLVIFAGVGLAFLLSWLAIRWTAVRRLINGVFVASGAIGALFLIAILVLICAQMGARWTGNVFPGSSAYAGYCMAAASFFALAYALNAGSHISVNLLLNALGGRRNWGEGWRLLVGALIATYFARYAIKAAILSEKLNDVSQDQDATPLWIPQISMCVGAVLLAWALWDNLFTLWLKRRTNIHAEVIGEGVTSDG